MDLILHLKVIPRSSKNEVVKIAENTYKAKITSPPHDGAANTALIELLSDYFSVSKSCVMIIKGSRSRNKVVKILR